MRTNMLAYLLPLGLLVGCGGADPNGSDAASVGAALDSSSQTADDSALLLAVTQGTESATSSNEAGVMAGAQAKSFWQPSTCVTATQTNNVVSYALANCTGPYGLVHVTGTVVATYTANSSGIHAAIVTSYIIGFSGGIDPHNGSIASLSTSLGGSALCNLGVALYAKDASNMQKVWKHLTTF